jgi:PAS domain S-box-containing protein
VISGQPAETQTGVQLEDLAAYLMAVVQSSDDAIISKDLTGRITFWNPAAERIFGYPAAEAIGGNIRLIIPHERLPEEDEIIAKIKDGQKVDHFETIRQKKDGTRINISITVSPIYNEDGIIIGASKIARDITERKEKDRSLHAATLRLELALSAAEMGDWDWDCRTDEVTFAEAGARIFGLDPGTKTTWKDLRNKLLPEDAERAVKAVEKAISGHSHYNIEYRIMVEDRIKWVAAKGFAQYDENGQSTGMVGVVQDITVRKEQEQTLETLSRLAPAFAATLDLQELLQLATDEATKVTGAAFGAFFYNAVNEDGKAYLLYTLSGAPMEAFSKLGMPRATAIFGPTFRGEGTILLTDVTKDSRYGQSAPHYGMPKGHLPVRSYLAVPVVSRSGEVIGGLFFGHHKPGVFRENNARLAEGIAAQVAIGIDNARLYEQVKKEKEIAEAASRAKTEFLANMSHEIRTPMNAVIGLANILSMSFPLTGKQREYIGTLQTSADGLLGLINDLLDVSKIESGSINLEEIPFSVLKIIEEVVDMIGIRAREKGLRLLTAIETQTLKKKNFLGDPTRFRQILTNLCGNAVKFTESGSITIEAVAIPTSDPIYETLRLTVSDTGIGIDSGKIEAIFDKFVQADSSISRQYGGTGLGLAITKMLLKAMGGSITVESEPGKGSRFTIEIPLKMAVLAEKQEDRPDSQTFLPISVTKPVLLVEDHEPNILVASILLENMGYSCVVAKTGVEAMDLAAKKEFCAILMDVQMPGMSGLEATRKIRENELKRGKTPVPIIGITAHAMRGDREKCLDAGMDDYIAKPFDPEDLKKTLKRLCAE